jgi:hypothetical protein
MTTKPTQSMTKLVCVLLSDGNEVVAKMCSDITFAEIKSMFPGAVGYTQSLF